MNLFHLASRNESSQVLEYLLDKCDMFDFNLETKSMNGYTPLLFACEHGSLDTVKLILLSVPDPIKLLKINPNPVEIAKPEIACALTNLIKTLWEMCQKENKLQN